MELESRSSIRQHRHVTNVFLVVYEPPMDWPVICYGLENAALDPLEGRLSRRKLLLYDAVPMIAFWASHQPVFPVSLLRIVVILHWPITGHREDGDVPFGVGQAQEDAVLLTSFLEVGMDWIEAKNTVRHPLQN